MPAFCYFGCFFVNFVLLNGVCYAEIKEINDIASDTKHINNIADNKNIPVFFSKSENFTSYSLDLCFKYARLFGEKAPYEEFSTL